MKDVLRSIVVRILIAESRILLKRKKPTIVAITGSVGKTSTKDAIYATLKSHMHVRKSEKNYNSDIGACLSILGQRNAWSSAWGWMKVLIDGALNAFFAKEYPKVLVLELGIDRPGDMHKLTQFITPDIVVLTRLPEIPVHVEFFDSPEQVSEEKMQLVRALRDDGVLIYNNDDEKVRRYVADEVRQQAFGYSRYSPSHFTASGDRIRYDGAFPSSFEFTLTHIDEEVNVTVRGSLGVQHAYNYSAAIAVASQFDIALQDAADALQEFVPPPGRMRLIPGLHNTLIIDDTYNASPVANERALQTLKELQNVKRKIAVLGDMLELGQFSVREHERLGAQCAQSADALLTIGLRSQKIASGALENGMDEAHIFQYEDAVTAGEELHNMLQDGDVILVKASQSIRAERVVAAVMVQPERVEELLVRQDTVWKQKV